MTMSERTQIVTTVEQIIEQGLLIRRLQSILLRCRQCLLREMIRVGLSGCHTTAWMVSPVRIEQGAIHHRGMVPGGEEQIKRR